MKQLSAPWRFLGRAVLMSYDELFLMLGLNLLQAICTLLVLPAPPVAAGLNVVANRMAREQRVNFDFFRQGFKEYFWKSYKILGFWAVIMFLLGINVYFYVQQVSGPFRYVGFLWMYLIVFWIGLLPFLLPVMIEMEEPILWLVYRNTVLLLLRSPLFAFMSLLQFVLLLLLLRYFFFVLFLVWPALVALTGNLGTRYLIERYKNDTTAGEP